MYNTAIEKIKFLKCPEEMIFYDDSVSYKIGEINIHPDLLKSNLAALLEGQFDKIEIIDLHLWQTVFDAACST